MKYKMLADNIEYLIITARRISYFNVLRFFGQTGNPKDTIDFHNSNLIRNQKCRFDPNNNDYITTYNHRPLDKGYAEAMKKVLNTFCSLHPDSILEFRFCRYPSLLMFITGDDVSKNPFLETNRAYDITWFDQLTKNSVIDSLMVQRSNRNITREDTVGHIAVVPNLKVIEDICESRMFELYAVLDDVGSANFFQYG